MINGAGETHGHESCAPTFGRPTASYRWGARTVPTPNTGWRKGNYMKGRRVSLRIGALSSVVALVVIALGAGAGQSAFAGPSATTLVDGTTDTVTNIDPAGAYDYGTNTLENNIFEHLLDFRHGPKLEPSLATKCFSVGSLRTWRCTLRRGVTFSDGSAFDSTDVKFSFDRVTNPTIVKEAAANSPSPLLGNLKSVTTNGKYAVTFRLKSPQVTWPSILATQAAFIVPSDTYEPNHLRGNTEAQIGTGPYVLTKYTPGQQAVFKRNNDYWGKPAKTDNLIIRYYAKSSTMKLAIQRGEIDMAFRVHADGAHVAPEAEGLRRPHGRGWADPLPRAEREASADEQPRRPPGDRVPDAAADDREPRLPRPREAALLDGAGGLSRPHRRVRDRSTARRPNLAKAKAVLRGSRPLRLRCRSTIWYTPTHYGDASADEYAEIQRALETDGALQGDAEVGRVGAVQRRVSASSTASSSSAGSRTIRTPRTTCCRSTGRHASRRTTTTARRWTRSSRRSTARRRCPQRISGASSRPSCWRRRTYRSSRTGRAAMIAVVAEQRAGHSDDARSDVHHAVLADLEVQSRTNASTGRPERAFARSARYPWSMLRTRGDRLGAMASQGNLAQVVPLDAPRARHPDGLHPADHGLPAHARRPRRPDLGLARRHAPAGGDRQDQARARLRQAAVRAVRRYLWDTRARRLRHDDHRPPSGHGHHQGERRRDARAHDRRDVRRDHRRASSSACRRSLSATRGSTSAAGCSGS